MKIGLLAEMLKGVSRARAGSIVTSRANFLFSFYLLTYLLIPWCGIFFEKLIVTQLVKRYPTFLWNPRVHYHVHFKISLETFRNNKKFLR
jgi:hypothetical protein